MTREREWENRLKRSWTPSMVRSTRGRKKAAGNAAHQQGVWSATQEKDMVTSPLRVEALTGAFWCRPLRQLCFNPRHDRSRPQHNLHGVRTACIVYLLACFNHRNGFPRDLLMRSTSRRLALDHRFASTVLWSLFAALIFQALASR